MKFSIYLKRLVFVMWFHFTDSKGMQARVNICDDKETTKDIHLDAGLLLSHNDYPWEYDARNLVISITPAVVCKKIFWLATGKKLVVAIHDLDLAEGDSFQVRTGNGAVMEYPNVTPVFDHSDTSVQFEFKMSLESNGGRGFVVCFKGRFSPAAHNIDTVMHKRSLKV